ncbi:MAG TPA: hypothetical protein VHE37_00180 [Nevskiaceae bacterium]|nr:hypothetical protein [Nevskiaceae bacterium]
MRDQPRMDAQASAKPSTAPALGMLFFIDRLNIYTIFNNMITRGAVEACAPFGSRQ